MEKNSEYKGEVLFLGSEGEGVIKCGGETAFVPFCLTGENVSFRVLKSDGAVAYGKLTEVHTLSPHRVMPECAHFGKCGGCQLQHMDYETQLEFKRANVKNCLKKLGGLEVEVEKVSPSPAAYGYRNKLAIPVGVDAEGNNVAGFYAPRSHRIIPIESCPLQPAWSEILICSVLKFMGENGLKGYDEVSCKGDIRHIVGREINGKLVITIVAARKIDLSPLCEILEGRLPKYTLWLNINTSRGNAVFGDEMILLKGKGFYESEWRGVRFKAGANTFLQINDGVREKLYSAVIKACADSDAVAIDLYSGGGLLTALLAKACRAAYGIEIVPEAVECAERLRRENKLTDRMFTYCGAVEQKIESVLRLTEGRRRVIVCDPPRKGMERKVVNAILKSGAEKVVLVSCNPATLARDVALLCGKMVEVDGKLVANPLYSQSGLEGYYKIISVKPFDMFPQTKHVETLVVLERV